MYQIQPVLKIQVICHGNDVGVAFNQMAALPTDRLNYETRVDTPKVSVLNAIRQLLQGIVIVSKTHDTAANYENWLGEVIRIVTNEKIEHSFHAVHGTEGNSVQLEIEVASAIHKEIREYPVFQPGAMVMRQHRRRSLGESLAAQGGYDCGSRLTMVPPQNYRPVAERPGMDVSAVTTNPNEPIVDIVTLPDPFKAVERGSLGQVFMTHAGVENVVSEFKAWSEHGGKLIQNICAVWAANWSLQLKEDALEYVRAYDFDTTVDDLVTKLGGMIGGKYVEKLAALAVLSGAQQLSRERPQQFPIDLMELKEEAELVLFKLWVTAPLGGEPMVDYDPRDNWDYAIRQFPLETAFGRRVNGLVGKTEIPSEEEAMAIDEEALATALETPHSTPHQVFQALYVLEHFGRGMPAGELIELLPSGFVQDFNDYCTAIGTEGPFGAKQMLEVERALSARWTISRESALAILVREFEALGVLGLPAAEVRCFLNNRILKMMNDQTLLYVNTDVAE